MKLIISGDNHCLKPFRLFNEVNEDAIFSQQLYKLHFKKMWWQKIPDAARWLHGSSR